jgi:hypothetical protein
MRYPTLRLFDGYSHTSPKLKAEVRKLQKALKEKGFPLKADGLFGYFTEATVKEFQQSQGLDADGVAGPKTWEKLIGFEPLIVGYPFVTDYRRDDPILLKELEETTNYRVFINDACTKYGFQPSVLSGIGSRESRWGLALKPQGPSGTGDFSKRSPRPPVRLSGLPPDGCGFGRGLMQIDYDFHKFARGENWKNARENILYGAKVLVDAQKYLLEKTGWDGLNLLMASVAAYNCGVGNVVKAIQNGLDIDYYSAGRNYSRNTLSRAGWFQLQGWE